MSENSSSEKGSQDAVARAPLEKVWEFEAAGDIVHKAVAHGMIFFGSKDKHIYALDAASGHKRWILETDQAAQRPLVIADGILYVIDKDTNLYAIGTQAGEKRWQFSTGKKIWLPNVADGVAYVVSDGKTLHALNAQTGLERWRFSTGKDIGSPAVGYGMVFFGSKDEHIYALGSGTGEKRWEFKTGHKNHSRPIVANGKILVGGDDDLYALDANSGALLWKIQKALHYGSPPIVVGNDVICTNELTVVDLGSGKEKTKLAPEMRFFSQLYSNSMQDILKNLYVRDSIVYAALGGTLFVIDLSTRELKWYAVIETKWPHYFDWVMSKEFVFATLPLYPTKTYGINISRFLKRWESSEPGSVPVIAGEMAFMSSGKKMCGYTSSKDPAAQSILEIGERVASSPEYMASVLLTTAGFSGGSGQIAWPNMCCLCCGPAEKRVDLAKEMDRVRLSAKGVPYCTTCYEKTMKGMFKKEKHGVEIIHTSPPTFAFRNEKYWGMFMEANRTK